MHSPTVVAFTLLADYQHLADISTTIDTLLSPVAFAFDPELFCYNIKLAVHEICNNIIEHAYHEQEGTIRITLRVDEDAQEFSADLYDTGQGFDPATVTMPDLSEPQEAGYGLFIVQQLMDEVHYTRQDEENHWRVVKRW